MVSCWVLPHSSFNQNQHPGGDTESNESSFLNQRLLKLLYISMKAPSFVPPYVKSRPAPLNWEKASVPNPAIHQEQKLPASPEGTSKQMWSQIKLSVRLELKIRRMRLPTLLNLNQ